MMLSLHVPSTVDGAAATSAHLEEVREKLWRALRVTHAQRAGSEVAADTLADGEEGGQSADTISSDVHSSPAAPATAPELTRADVEQLISCAFCAVHTNATAHDANGAADLVLRQMEDTAEGKATSSEVVYSMADVSSFLDTVAARWLPDLVAAQEEAAQRSAGNTLWEDFNAELIDCIVNDEEPHNLLQPSQVLTLQRTTAAVELDAPFADYFTVAPKRAYPPVYDTLFTKLCYDGRSVVGLSQSQFRLFFHWFYAMHFRNTNLSRSNAAADGVYQRYCDAHGELTVAQFQLACEEVCGVYAQRRDASAYLHQLVQRTEEVMAEGGGSDRHAAEDGVDSGSLGAEFFLHPEKVTLPAWQRDLLDPTQLYLPDELRVVQQEAERHHRHTSPRILLVGPIGIGKTAAGAALAEALHCVHLDVAELALAALQPNSRSSMRDVVASCVQERKSVPMTAQVTLLREAMLSERVQHRGYVLSDTIATTADTHDQVEDHFIRPLKVQEEAKPDHVVELVCAVPEVYHEYASAQAEALAASSTAAWVAVDATAERRRQAAEKQQMKAGCEKLLARLAELEGAAARNEVSPEELEKARQQATEAQDILDALNAEEDAHDDAETPADADLEHGKAAEEEDASPDVNAAREREELRLRVAALIYEGRKEAGLLPVTASPSGTCAPLSSQDWLSCWRKSTEPARVLGRYLSVDPISTSDTAHLVSYIAHTFDMRRCDLAEVVDVPQDEQAGNASNGRPSSLAEDEERCRAVEEIVAERGLRPSPVWKRFCPVTALKDGVLIDGAACHACAYRGCYYYFASVSKRDAFVENPTRYLREAFPEQKAVLLLVEDAIMTSMPDVVQQFAEDMATQLRLTPVSATTFAKTLEPRQELLRARAAAQEARRKAEGVARKARHDRQEQAAKAQSKKPKGKLEPAKPKSKRLSISEGRISSLQTSQQQIGKSNAGGRRRVPRAVVVEGPRCMADEKQALIDAAKERRSQSAPLLVTAMTFADLDLRLLQKLAEQQLLPETVVALSLSQTGLAGFRGDGEEGEEKEGDGDGAETNTSSPSSSALQRILKMLETGAKPDWRATKAEGNETNTASSPYDVHAIPVNESATAAEVLAEVLQQLNPLAILASEDVVDEALGEEDGEGGAGADGEDDEDEELAAEDEALLYPEGAPRPVPAARVSKDPLVKPTRRFLHQFGSRLDYCPVTLHDRGILVRGKQELCLRYVDGLHIFASEEARDAFARCPQRYVGNLPPQDVPPRVWLVGVTQSGKRSLASGLQEAYRVPYFVYDRQFFEECVEAALTPGGGMVRGVYIPADSKESNSYLKRAFTLLESVHDKEKEEKKRLEEKAEAERLLEEHERQVEERETREDAGSEDEDDDTANADWSEEKEAALQEKLEFEPEDEEEKQMRLSEAYLRIASCVTRFRPFDRLGYVMICPPFSDGDLDVLFDEGGIPEVVVRLNVDEDVFNQRSAMYAAARRTAVQKARELDVAAKEREAAQLATQSSREALQQRRAREKALAKWRRRHIGADDVDGHSDADGENGEDARNTESGAGDGEARAGGSNGNRTATEEGEGDVEVQADRQAQEDALEEFMAFVEERRVEVVRINAAAAKETVRRAVMEALGRHLANRASLFYHPEVLRPEAAALRLASGLADWSCFGSHDPVRLYAYRREGQRAACTWKPAGLRVAPEDEYGSDEEEADTADNGDGAEERPPAEEPEELSEVASEDVEELRAAVKRRDNRLKRDVARRVARVHNRLYTFDDDATLLRFMRNPWPFMQEPPPCPPLSQAPVVSVYEPDARFESEVAGAKNRCLADSVAFNLHNKCVSTSSLLAWGAVHAHWQSLRLDCMLAAQQSRVDAALIQKLLTLYLCSAEAKEHGAVLHNLPATAASAEALTRVSTAAPAVRVMTAFSSDADTKSSLAAVAEVVESMKAYASVELVLPHPRVPLDSSNLVTAVHGVGAFRVAAQEARLRESRAFPIALRDSYEIFRHVQRHLSEFGAFCPYEWVEKGDLVRCFPTDLPASASIELGLGAKYLGQYFFFSSTEYLGRFLQNPTTVTDPATAKPMPKHLPSSVPAAEAAHLEEADLALEGCCPVLLYDTRDRRGMRGVRQPVARKGSLDCVVEYEGRAYAMLNAEHRDRFLRRPWQYTEGAALPAVLRRPLPKGVTPSSIVDTEEYLQRQLYDPVAQALLAVSRERPIYPGLSAEESALKYVALYLKAHRDPATISDFEAESYKLNFERFHKRATLYRQLASDGAKKRSTGGGQLTSAVAAASAHGSAADVTLLADGEEVSQDFCASFEEVHADAGGLGQFNQLQYPSHDAWR